MADVLTTGFHELDRRTGGLRSGDLVLASASPDDWTLDLLLSIMRHTCGDLGYTAALFSQGYAREQIAAQLIASTARVPGLDLYGPSAVADFKSLHSAALELSSLPLFIDDREDLSLADFRSACKKLASDRGLRLAVLDPLPLEMAEDPAESIRLLKEVAHELEISILGSCAAPIPDDETSSDRQFYLVPMVANVCDWAVHLVGPSGLHRQSASVEHDAKLVLFHNRRGALSSAPVDVVVNCGCVIGRLPLESDPKLHELILDCNREAYKWLASHPEALHRVSPRAFEEIIADIFKSQGYAVELTKQTRDGGVDLIAVRKQWPGTDFRVLVECKRYAPERKVDVRVVRGMAFLLDKFRADRAILATTSYFSRDAWLEAAHPFLWRVSLADFDEIRRWLQDYSNQLDPTS